MDHHCNDHRPCPVPPHPDLQLDASIDVTRPLGFNDGLLWPLSAWPEGTSSEVAAKAAQTEPVKGPVNVLVVLVNFQNKKMDDSKKTYFKNLFFNKGKFQVTYDGTQCETHSVTDYYTEVSGGVVSFTGQVVGPYTLDHDVEWYANGWYGGGHGSGTPTHSDWGNIQQMGSDALDKLIAEKQVDLKIYDNDHRFSDHIDALIFVHAGNGAEETLLPNTDLWSCKWTLPGGHAREVTSTSNQQVKIFPFLTVPETAKLGVCCHEIGHLVFGWPDLYDVQPGPGCGLGRWCLMAGGSWLGTPRGIMPSHPSAWCKANARWIKPDAPTTNGSLTINANVINSNGTCTLGNIGRLWTDGDPNSTEYFLVENRQKVGFDGALPGTGLMIYHVDDGIKPGDGGVTEDNDSGDPHYHVALEDACGGTIKKVDSADSPFPSSRNVTSFTATSDPNSKSWAGSDTSISITNISKSQQSMTIQVAVKK